MARKWGGRAADATVNAGPPLARDHGRAGGESYAIARDGGQGGQAARRPEGGFP